MPKKRKEFNVVGPQIRKLRERIGLTQDWLAARCQIVGFDISREVLSHIEAQVRKVSDQELYFLAKVLKVTCDSLFPRRVPRPSKRKPNYVPGKTARQIQKRTKRRRSS